MRALRWALLTVLLLPASAVLWGQSKEGAPYQIDFDSEHDVKLLDRDAKGAQGLFINVRFSITLKPGAADDAGANYKLVIEEDGHRVREEDVPRPTPVEDVSVMLALDTSGSMNERKRMAQAKAAAEVFLQRLPASAECGLILFDHEMRPPVLEPARDRALVRKEIDQVQPRGGTAYLDATGRAIAILAKAPSNRDKAVVLLTDGVDLNSVTPINEVILQAIQNKVRVYPIGIGEPGRQERVGTVLVLDHSGSMKPPADDQDQVSKMEALHRAAKRFVDIMPSRGFSTVVPFSTDVGRPGDFVSEKRKLTEQIKKLQPFGETALFDATYTAIATLDAEGHGGKRAVVAMTDGIDNASRRRVDEVIERAKEAKIPLYMLGFGREGELDRGVMEKMAGATGGRYYHAKNEKALLDIFEHLSIELHDEGIDEIALKRLAGDTGGQYYPAKNVADLRLILEQVSQKVQQKQYLVTFPSKRQVRDGTARNVTIKLVRRSGEVVSNQALAQVSDKLSANPAAGQFTEEVVQETKAGYQLPGIVVAEMNHLIYLGLLGVIGLLISLPALARRRSGAAPGGTRV
jgi:VWFA-related protein